MEGSNFGYREWVIAIYMVTTSLKGVIQYEATPRPMNHTQKAAWHLMQRICKGFTLNTRASSSFPAR